MASLKPVIEEIDLINEKLERMAGLLAKALEDYRALADLQRSRTTRAPVQSEQVGGYCRQLPHFFVDGVCAECGAFQRPLPNRSDGG